MDRQVAGRRDPGLANLLSRFVCVRIVEAKGMDLSLFQFDYEQTWAAFFLNAEEAIYGRYGTRSSAVEAERHLSIEGFKKALEGALDLHARYPGNKKELAAKTGPPSPWRTPENIPGVAPWGSSQCYHCHQ